MSVTGQSTARDSNLEREKAWLAIMLAWVAGFIDAVSYLTLLHIFVSHMSGNSVGTGADLARHQWDAAARRAFPIPVFVLGVFSGAIVGIATRRAGIRRRLSIALLLEIVLLVAFIVFGFAAAPTGNLPSAPVWHDYLLTSLLVFAMGLQSSALRRVRGQSVHTAYVTGMLTHCAEDAAALFFRGFDRLRSRSSELLASRRDHFSGMIFYGGIWLAFVLGALCGGLGESRWNLRALIVPVLALALIIAFDLIWPVHD